MLGWKFSDANETCNELVVHRTTYNSIHKKAMLLWGEIPTIRHKIIIFHPIGRLSCQGFFFYKPLEVYLFLIK